MAPADVDCHLYYSSLDETVITISAIHTNTILLTSHIDLDNEFIFFVTVKPIILNIEIEKIPIKPNIIKIALSNTASKYFYGL